METQTLWSVEVTQRNYFEDLKKKAAEAGAMKQQRVKTEL